jgi:hypothetical protein
VSGVIGDLADRFFHSPLDNGHASQFVAATGKFVEYRQDVDEGGAAAGNNAFFNSRAGGVEGVFDAVLSSL